MKDNLIEAVDNTRSEKKEKIKGYIEKINDVDNITETYSIIEEGVNKIMSQLVNSEAS